MRRERAARRAREQDAADVAQDAEPLAHVEAIDVGAAHREEAGIVVERGAEEAARADAGGEHGREVRAGRGADVDVEVVEPAREEVVDGGEGADLVHAADNPAATQAQRSAHTSSYHAQVIDGKPSRTAKFVAATRALGALLPEEAQLIDDPYGARVAGAGVSRLVALSRRAPSLRPLLRVAAAPMLPMIAYMQVRTRLIDDCVRRFAAFGGAQIVLLGAGFDSRAARLADVLGDSRVFEVDHPATQALKRARFGDLRVTFVPWNFERDAMATLGARLESLGHDPSRPTLTIWEGVTMYLYEPAIADTVAAVRAWSAPGSQLCFSYVDLRQIEHPKLTTRIVTTTVRAWGEPWRFGWEPRALGGWLAAHGYRLVSDEDVDSAGRRLLPRRFAALLRRTGDRHIAVAEPTR